MTSRRSTMLDKDTRPSPTLGPTPEREPAQRHEPLSPAALVQRASRYPASITHSEVRHLHRALGNRNVGRLLQRDAVVRSSAPAMHPAAMVAPP